MGHHGDVHDEESPTERILDVVLYAPVGLAVEAGHLLPRLADKGRERIGAQVALARVIGSFAVRWQRQEMQRRLTSLRCRQDRDGTEETPAATEAVPTRPTRPRPVAPTPVGPTNGNAPDAESLAIPDYDSLAASQVVPRLAGLSADELDDVRRYEEAHRGRKTILARIAQLRST